MEIMTKENKRWGEFTHRLGMKVCKNDKQNAKAILQEMGDIDIEKTMEYFDENGGYCDCEILFNVDN